MHRNKKGYTLVEILVIMLIIGLLASIVLGFMISRGRDKAVVSSYKSSMKSLRTSFELCIGTGGTVSPGGPNDLFCDTDLSLRYPDIQKCGAMNFNAFQDVSTDAVWAVTTTDPCLECRLICDVNDCIPSTTPGEDQCF